jgi:predicted glycoside hydrolase/deacetylase ChbG (UPF0249 family)
MANSAAFDDAVTLARTLPSLSVGCHVTLIDAEPLAGASAVPSLVGKHAGECRRGIGEFALAAVRGRIREDDILAEANAQFAKLRAAGLQPSHFDTHKHTHLFPQVLRPLLTAARAHGVRAVRNPFAPVRPLALAHLTRRPHLWQRYAEVKVLRVWAERFRRAAAEAGLATTDGSFGIVVTGALDLHLFEAIVGSLPEGTWEFVCHPGYDDADLGRVRTRLRASRVHELEVLTSGRARDILHRRGVELISYHRLQTESPALPAESNA